MLKQYCAMCAMASISATHPEYPHATKDHYMLVATRYGTHHMLQKNEF